MNVSGPKNVVKRRGMLRKQLRCHGNGKPHAGEKKTRLILRENEISTTGGLMRTHVTSAERGGKEMENNGCE